MKTRVVHHKKEKPNTYIGRPSKWGNPFTHLKEMEGKPGMIVVASREEAIEKYREWILTQPTLLASLDELRGKALGCWCKPKSCHGDVLVDLIENGIYLSPFEGAVDEQQEEGPPKQV